MKNQYDIVVVGAGASGMAAALATAEVNPDTRILVLEKNPAPGKKIRATGNGRCNISNIHAEHYPEARSLLRKWGIITRDYPSGLVYPYSESAGAVAEILATRMQEMGIELWTSMAVTDVLEKPFRLQVERCEKKKTSEKPERFRIQAKKVILASGGKAGPDFGTIGDGYRWVRNLGHQVISPIPVLTPVDCKEDSCEKISGTRAKGIVTLYRKTEEEWKCVFTEEGEIQFTATGLSGICVFNMTRNMRFDRTEGLGVFRVEVDLCPDLDVKTYLEEWKENETELEIALRTLLREKLSQYVVQRAEIPPKRRCKELTEKEIRSLEETLHHLRFRPTGIHGWKEAQCTAGGVSLEEIDARSQESLICPGLYITGELQDYDGPCGGYNLNHAWVTGARAGADAAKKLKEL